MTELRIIGRVESSLTDAGRAPTQGEEGAPDARIAFVPEVLDALGDMPRAIGSSSSPGSTSPTARCCACARATIRPTR